MLRRGRATSDRRQISDFRLFNPSAAASTTRDRNASVCALLRGEPRRAALAHHHPEQFESPIRLGIHQL